ncbi:Glucose 1-dehydrogenase [Roseimaritima multifibrata]|uniref:Glucose 1-dehydrogenase n=1 Tax=Roseimaritima multifibrata TaxID=1930274 RepID=A0A517MD80_9BACT|nr:SDR family NAD(P)-dependent oxidoreductase [Roseimaritima multifibrata]QDS92842.1 Glucose 1-dehydrogenase [Roseimaritima multifibrata]
MEITLEGKVVWVTGGSEGIGRAIAVKAADCGARVVVTARDADSVNAVVSQIEAKGRTALAVTADVSVPDEMEKAVNQIIAEYGRLDVVVANAGTNGTWAPIHELSHDEWTKTISVNLTGTYLAIHHAVPHLKNAGGGSIVIMSSVNGTRMFSNEGASAYAASKAGQFALGQMLALELAPSNIRVNVICPGAIESNIHGKTEKQDLATIETPVEFPAGKIPLTAGKKGKAEDVAKLTIFLASDAASHITGTPVWIDGAQSLLQG